jgi:DNA-binding NtrC family response regulator
MQTKVNILVVDDDDTFRKMVKSVLEEKDYHVEAVEKGSLAIEWAKEKTFDILLSDLKMEGMDGIAVLKEVKSISPDTEVIMITGQGSYETAMEATKLGAFDYIQKSAPIDEILLRVERALEKKKHVEELKRLKEEVSQKYEYCNIVSKDPKMKRVFDLIDEVAQTDVTVLVRGETGTGKELVAKAIHYNSARKDKPFVAVNCAALTETLLESELFGHEKGAFTGAFKQKIGRFELANTGTIFLDEVGDIPLATQVKLLRVLQEKKFERVGSSETVPTDVRIIGATNKNVEQLIKKGLFREDLYYRINVFPMYIPPLRERPSDIPILAEHFLKINCKKFNKKVRVISPEALRVILLHSWPGNVRELENVIERATLLEKGEELQVKDIQLLEAKPVEVVDSGSKNMEIGYKEYINEIVSEAERKYFVNILSKYMGNIRVVAKKSGVDRKTVYRKMKEYNIEIDNFRADMSKEE